MDQKIKDELFLLSEAYFSSIESLLKYKQKTYWRDPVFAFFFVILVIWLVFTIIPLIPYLSKNLIIRWFGESISIKNYNIPINDFFIRWLLLSIVHSIIFAIFYFIFKYYENKSKKYSIPISLLRFAFLGVCIKELKLFLINERDNSLDLALKHLDAYYFIDSDAYEYHRSYYFVPSGTLYLPGILNELAERRFWVKYDDITKKVIRALEEFEDKVQRRIEERRDIDQVIIWLSNLLVYEYSKIKKIKGDELTFTNKPLAELGENCFLDFCDFVNSAAYVEEPRDYNKWKLNFIKTTRILLEIVNTLFTNKVAVLTFLSWVVLLTLIVTIGTYCGIKIFNLKVDNTIFISSLTAIILGSVTITATIYNKKNN